MASRSRRELLRVLSGEVPFEGSDSVWLLRVWARSVARALLRLPAPERLVVCRSEGCKNFPANRRGLCDKCRKRQERARKRQR